MTGLLKATLLMLFALVITVRSTPNGFASSIPKTLARRAAGSLSIVALGLAGINPNGFYPTAIANADSTGKMSTKLTARKRYLPRIEAGRQALRNVHSDSDALRQFVTSEDFSALTRAMSLYGASLRKGEVPDSVSRQAEQLTTVFERDCTKFSKSGGSEELRLCLKDFDDYLTFSKLD
jgi:hypothetical protein